MNIHNTVFASTLGKSFLSSKYRIKPIIKKGSEGSREKKEKKMAKIIHLSSERENEAFRPIWGRM